MTAPAVTGLAPAQAGVNNHHSHEPTRVNWFSKMVSTVFLGAVSGVKHTWGHLSNRIVLYLGVATQSYVVGNWFFNSMDGVNRFWDGVFAIIAGIALDLMVVKVATGPQDYDNAIIWTSRTPFRVNFNWSKLTPLAAYIASSLIAYDTYAVASSAWIDTKALLHVAFPTVVYFASQYEAYMRHVQAQAVHSATQNGPTIELLEQRIEAIVAERVQIALSNVTPASAVVTRTYQADQQPTTSDQIRAYLADRPGATNKDISLALGCAPSLVSRIRNETKG